MATCMATSVATCVATSTRSQLPGTARQLPIPAEFLAPGSYKAEVLAVEQSGNQTLTEVAFTIR